MAEEVRKQQFKMVWPEHRLTTPVPVILPEEYRLRVYTPDDREGYLQLVAESGLAQWTEEDLPGKMAKALPDGVFVVVHKPTGKLVATAMATHNPAEGLPFAGELGWVAADPNHSGNGLGRAVCDAVINRYIEAGYKSVYLKTDDWRLPAVKTYLKMGYLPYLFAPDMEERWRVVCEKLGWPFTPDKWPPKTPPEERSRPDDAKPDNYPIRHKWLPERLHRGFACTGDVDAFGDESLYKPSMLGSASVEPREVEAAGTSDLTLTYQAGPAGVPEGVRVTFVMRGQNPLAEPSRGVGSIEAPEECLVEPIRWGFHLKRGSLKEGDTVTLRWPAFQWTPVSGRREYKVVIDYRNGRPQQRLPEPLVIDVCPRAVRRLVAILPCTHRGDNPVAVNVKAPDEFGNHANLEETIVIEAGDERRSASMVGGSAACEIAGEETLRAKVSTSDGRLETVSNPSVRSDDLQLYVGDLHCHDFMSEAEGYPDAVYRWACEEQRLDFASVVPQLHGWLDNETWTVAKYMNERFLNEGRFVTFLGFEWQHTGYGDKVIHYLGGDQPFMPVQDSRYDSPRKLYEALRESDATVISHHPCYPAGSWCGSTDFDCVETDIERVVELWSMHGSSEGYDPEDRPLRKVDPERQVMAALRKGLRLGFVAGSDTHSGRPGGSAREPMAHWGGLAAVWAENLTRRDLFQAIRARQTYALTRARIVLKMTVNGALMGSEIPSADSAAIQIDAWAPGTIAKVEVLKNTRLLQTFAPEKDECHLQLEDKTGGSAFYHCRVTLEDGNLAVCSPVWVG